ncbi:MAG: carbon monoxide dehydrogenase, partial [Acidobacteria bacterium]
MAFPLTVNGFQYVVDVEPETPLLWAIRDAIDLTGTKYGCGIAQCGACTVHLNGRAVRSCSIPVKAAVGAKITTIEGLSVDGTHPVQLAWKELDVPQCGYCQSGMIMAAVALLQRTPAPTDADIDTGVTNACRCGTYSPGSGADVRFTVGLRGGETMTPKKTVSEAMTAHVEKVGIDRRQFFITTAAVGGALVVGFGWPRRADAVEVTTSAAPWYREPSVPEINAWIVVAPDDTVTIRIGQTELGQGVWTACAMMIAEELQCEWSKVRGEYASANRDAREKAPEWTLK